MGTFQKMMKRRTIAAFSFSVLLMLSGFHSDKYRRDNSIKNHHALQDTTGNKLRRAIVDLQIPNLTVTEIELISDTYTPKGATVAITGLPEFYRVAASIKPAPGSDIKIEVWLPTKIWNGNFLGTGNGGGGGTIIYGNLVGGVKKGYATANTDLGTSHGGAYGAVGNPDVWADFGYRATHLMTEAGKTIVKAFYNKGPHFSYFSGCSTGGQQALMEAQRFPNDYNGIIAGAPANNRTHLHTGFLWAYHMGNQGGKPLFSKNDLNFITRKILALYGGKNGGTPGDHFLTDPRLVDVDYEQLFGCKAGHADSCLTSDQINALKSYFKGPYNLRSRQQIYTPPPQGTENIFGGLTGLQTKEGLHGLDYLFTWVFGKGFDPEKYDFDKDQARVDSVLAPVLNANNPDLKPFKMAGGKLIIYGGSADPLVPFQDALNYYERVIAKQHGLKKTQDFCRYFLVPGMGHCGGGPGLQGFDHDILSDLSAWVEHGTAPEQIVASGFACCGAPGTTVMKRPVYPYPKFAKYMGGDPNSPLNYTWVVHARGKLKKPADVYLQ